MEVRTDHRSLENWATEDLKTVGGPSPRQARWHELFSNFDLHVVYTPGPVNPVGDFCPVGLTLLTRHWVMCPYMGRPKRPGMCGT